MKRVKQEIVEVEWLDACSRDPWEFFTETLERPAKELGTLCRTIGYVIRKDVDTITVAGTISDDASCCQMMIPRLSIRSIRTVR